MKKIVYLFLILNVCLISCSKKNAPLPLTDAASPAAVPAGRAATVKGMVSPADAVTAIVIYDANNARQEIKPDANGAFAISDLPAGTYFISYDQGLGYMAQPARTLDLRDGQSFDLGKVVFSSGLGSIEGTVAPLGAATGVTVTNGSTNKAYTAVPDASTGKFKFDQMPGGIYTVSYTATTSATTSATAPPAFSETLPASQHLTLPLAIFKTPGVTGSISGKTDPGNSVSVSITKADNSYGVIVYPDASSGYFVSPALLPGVYNVTFGHDWTHKSPPGQTITVPPGQNVDLGTISAALNLYLIPFTANGTATVIGAEVSNCFYNAPGLSITGVNGGGIPEAPSRTTSLAIRLDEVNGPGTYTLQGTPTSNMTYVTGLVVAPQKWGMANGGSATVVITAIDPVQRVITGTFSATLKPANANAAGDMVITKGIISLTY